jgi:Xaa-Pro aminopeptidase
MIELFSRDAQRSARSAEDQKVTAPVQESPRPAEKTKVLLTPAESDRRADINGKQSRVAGLLQEAGCDGLLILEPENFSWLTSGGTAGGALDPDERPALFYTPDQRWILSSNVDSQRLFDEEVNGLGFQVQEWPWQKGRRKFLEDFCAGKRLACDRVMDDMKPVGENLRHHRRALTAYEQVSYRVLGQIAVHALEATGRAMAPDELSEQEVAGQISHRLWHRGAEPLALSIMGDGRSSSHRQGGASSGHVRRICVLTLTARKFGLCVTSSRALSFGAPEEVFSQEQDTACKISATYIASTWPDALPRQILATGRRVYQLTGYEHEWRLSSQGHVTGRSSVELAITPQTEELFRQGWAVTWRASVGAALSCDTFLVTDQGPESITPTESWPQKRIRVQGGEFLRPFILQR